MAEQESHASTASQMPRQHVPPHQAPWPEQTQPGPMDGMGRLGGLTTFGTVFAGAMLILVGLLQIAMGIAAIAGGKFYVSTSDNLFEFDLSGWGWLHLIVGALVVGVGVGVLVGKVWAFLAAIVLATFSAIDNFLFLPHYPVWSIVIIALNVLVIWSLARRLSSEAEKGGLAGTRPEQYPPGATAPAQQDIASSLARLGEMVQQGLLTNEEFTAAKAKLIG